MIMLDRGQSWINVGRGSMLAFGQRQRRRRWRNLLQRRRIASDLDYRPDQLAISCAMIMLNLRKLLDE
jgi:hypothetical protein